MKVEQKAQDDRNAAFLKQQPLSLDKQRPSWTEPILRDYISRKPFSSKGYNHASEINLFKLPCRTTLQKYVGSSDGETGISQALS